MPRVKQKARTIKGRIVKLEGKYAVVALERTEMCDRCRACRVSKDSKHVETKVKNALGANVGDIVDVNMHRIPLLWSSLIYLVPLALVAAGVAIGYPLSAAAMGILSGAGLLIGLGVAIPIDALILKRKLRPKMTAFGTDETEDSKNVANCKNGGLCARKSDIKCR